MPQCFNVNSLYLCALSYMTRKVFAFAKGECCQESADNPAFQEVLLGGHLYQMILTVLALVNITVVSFSY